MTGGTSKLRGTEKGAEQSPWVKALLEGILASPELKAARHQSVPFQVSDPASQPAEGPLDLGQALASHRRVILTGPARFGKTTLLLSILYEYASQMAGRENAETSRSSYCEEARVPLYLDLAQLSSSQSLEDLAARWCMPLAGQEVKAGQVSDLLARRECLVLMDHMDRLVGRPHLEGLNALRDLMVDRYPQQRYVLALPQHEYPLLEDWLPPAHVLNLMPLAEEDVLTFLHTQHGEVQARRIVRALRTRGLWDMVRDPFLLSIVIELMRDTGPAEPGRAGILAQVTDRVLRGAGPLRDTLAELALALERERRDDFDWGRCRSMLDGSGDGADGQDPCRALLGAGVLRSLPGGEKLAFCHPGLQQFLAGQALRMGLERGESLLSLLGSYGPCWAETLSLLYGSMPKPKGLLEVLIAPESPFEAVYLAAFSAAQNEPRARLRQSLHPSFFDPQVNFLLGKALLGLGFPEEARLELEEALRFRPDRADIHYEHARVLRALDKPEAALGSFQRAAGLGPPSSEVGLEMALEMGRGQDPGRAASFLEQALDALNQRKADTHYRLAEIYLEAGRLKEALAQSGEALRLVSSAAGQCMMGRVLDRLGNRAEAGKYFRQALAQDPVMSSALLGLGRLHEEEGDLAAALDLYRAALARDPQEPGHYLNVGRVYRQKGQFVLSKVYIGAALDLDPSHAPALAEMGALLEAQARYHEAAEQLRRAIDLRPREADYHYRLGWLLKLAGRPAQAETELRAAIERKPGQAEYHNQLGVVLTDLARHREAFGAYEQASRLEPQNPLYHRNVGVALAQLGQAPEALRAFDRALDLCHSTGTWGEPALLTVLIAADAHSERGQILEKMGDGVAALREYQRAVELMPTESAYRLRQALAYGHFSEPFRMLHILRRTVQMRPDDGLAYYHLGEALEAMGQAEESLDAYQRAVEILPREGPLWKSLGRVQRALGQTEASVETLSRCRDLAPGDAGAHYELGLSLEQAGRGQEAEECYRRAARLDVDREEYWMALGRCCRGLGRLADSQAALRRVLFLNPAHTAARSEMAETYLRQGRPQEALTEALAAIKGDPEVGRYHHQAASIYREAGRDQDALLSLNRAVELEPHQSDWHTELGEVLEGMGEWENALSEYERACQWDPDSSRGFYLLGRLHHRLGRSDEAVAELERAVAIDQGSVEARILMADLFLERGDFAQALDHCRAIMEAAPDSPQAPYLASRALLRLGREQEAVEHLEKATSLRPDDPAWLRELGQVYAGAGRLLEAQQAYQRALTVGPDPVLRRELAHLYRRMGWRQEAVKELQKALEDGVPLGPETRGLWLLDLGDFYQDARDWQQASEAYEAARALLGDRGEVNERRGSLLVRTGRYREARAELEEAASRGYMEPRASHTLSVALLGLGDAEGALRQAIKAAFAEPANPQFQRHLGTVLRLKGDLNSAMNYLQRALALAPSDPENLLQMGLALEDKGDVKEALRLYQQAVELSPDDPALRLELGRLRLNLGGVDDSLADLQAAVEGAPDNPQARFLLGRALEALGSLERAREQYAAASGLDPQVAMYHFHLGKTLEALGELSGAVAALRQALDLEGRQASWHVDLAALYGRIGETDQAGREYRRALELAPPSYDNYLQAGTFYREGGLYREALSLLERAVALAPSRAEGQRQLGLVKLEMGRQEEGLKALQKAADLSPRDPLYQIELANAYRLRGDPGEAAKRLLGITKEWPDRSLAHYYLGLALAEQRWHAEALAPLSRAVELDGQNPHFRCALATSLVALNQQEEALAQLREVSTSPGARSTDLVEAGLILEEMGRPEDALGVYRHGLEKEQRADLYYRASRVLRLLGRKGDAEASLRAALALDEQAAWENELGELLEEEGRPADALPCFQRALQLGPTDPQYHRNVGVALERLHRYEAARESLQEAIRLRPDYKDALGHLASVTAKITLEREVKKRSSQH